MALVPTFRLRMYSDFDGDVVLQQMFLEGGVVPVWQDVPTVSYYDEEEVALREAAASGRKDKGKKPVGLSFPLHAKKKDT